MPIDFAQLLVAERPVERRRVLADMLGIARLGDGDDPRAPHDQDVWECFSCALPLTHVTWHDVSGARDVLDSVLVVLIVLFMALLLRKLVRWFRGVPMSSRRPKW